MTDAVSDLAYAQYMLRWIDTLPQPRLPIAQEALARLRGHWKDQVPADLEATADELWAWVDANGGAGPSTDKTMILVRMLICLATASNQELQRKGYFESLLRASGVRPEQILSSHPGSNDAAQLSSPTAQEPLDARLSMLRRMKVQVLWAFAALSFVSGAHPIVAMTEQTGKLIETGLIVAMIYLIFLWYRLDSDERAYPRSLALNLCIVLVAAVGVPYYLIRSRGWPQAQVSLIKAIGVFMGSMVLSALGGVLFGHASP